jgi:hypothetical protein
LGDSSQFHFIKIVCKLLKSTYSKLFKLKKPKYKNYPFLERSKTSKLIIFDQISQIFLLIKCFSNCRCVTKQGVALPLPEMRVRVHRHQQGGGPPAAAPEARLDHGRRLREVHAVAKLQRGQLRPQPEADPLPLLELPLRGARSFTNVSTQVPASRIVRL